MKHVRNLGDKSKTKKIIIIISIVILSIGIITGALIIGFSAFKKAKYNELMKKSQAALNEYNKEQAIDIENYQGKYYDSNEYTLISFKDIYSSEETQKIYLKSEIDEIKGFYQFYSGQGNLNKFLSKKYDGITPYDEVKASVFQKAKDEFYYTDESLERVVFKLFIPDKYETVLIKDFVITDNNLQYSLIFNDNTYDLTASVKIEVDILIIEYKDIEELAIKELIENSFSSAKLTRNFYTSSKTYGIIEFANTIKIIEKH